MVEWAGFPHIVRAMTSWKAMSLPISSIGFGAKSNNEKEKKHFVLDTIHVYHTQQRAYSMFTSEKNFRISFSDLLQFVGPKMTVCNLLSGKWGVGGGGI